MKEEQEQEQEQELQQQELRADEGNSATKRKMEDTILLAKQKAQEIAARLVSNASESKRPRIGDESPESVPYSNSASVNTPYPVPFVAQTGQYEGSQTTNKRISIPTGKVGLIIGKGGETIKYLQSQAGAKIQITKDLEADPHSRTRDVELMGTSEQIINDMIGQSELGSSTPSTNHAANSVQPGAEQFIMKIPNNKVALIIGKGGESIRTMQTRSGARIQIIPLHLPPGDTSTERNVYIDGLPDQIEAAKELINEVISGKRIVNPTSMNSYAQSAYPPAGNWGAPGQPQQQSQYGYTQPGSYAQPHPPVSYYGHYPPQGTGWDQQNQSSQQTANYGYYGQQAQVGSAPMNPSYNYNQSIPTSHGFNQNYTQQPPNYGQPDTTQLPASDQQQPYVSSDQNTQPSHAYPYAQYAQPAANPHAGYWTYPSNTGQQPSQPVYDQTGYYQAAYGGLPQVPTTAPNSEYGEDAQSAPSAAGYVETPDPSQTGQHQEQQPPEPPATNGFGPNSVNGAQTEGNGSASAVQETADPQAEVGGA